MRITYSTPQQPEANCVGDRYRETLTQGRDYEVVALEFSSWVENPRLQCYIFDDDGFSWPRPYPLDIFMITDARVSRQWIVRKHDLHSGQLTMISFPAWADDPYFYDRILNDDAAACAYLDEFLRGERLRAQEDSLVDLRTALLAAGAPENSIEQVLTLLTHGEPELAREDIAALMDGKAQNQRHQQAVERALQLHSGHRCPNACGCGERRQPKTPNFNIAPSSSRRPNRRLLSHPRPRCHMRVQLPPRFFFTTGDAGFHGELCYYSSEYSFDFHHDSVQEPYERDTLAIGGRTSVLVDMLQLEVNTTTRRILYPWGVCGYASWKPTERAPIQAPTGAVYVCDAELVDGISVPIGEEAGWLASVNQDARTVFIDHWSLTADTHVCIATGVIMGFKGHEVASLQLTTSTDLQW